MTQEMWTLLGQDEFVAKLNTAGSAGEIRALFAENGVEIDLREAERFAIGSGADAGALGESDLEAVAGGMKVTEPRWIMYNNEKILLPAMPIMPPEWWTS